VTRSEALAFSPDGALFAQGCDAGQITVGGGKRFTTAYTLLTPEGRRRRMGVNDVAFSPDGALLAVCSHGGIQLFSTVDQSLVRTLEGSTRRLAWSADGRFLADGSYRGLVRIWSTETWDVISSLPW